MYLMFFAKLLFPELRTACSCERSQQFRGSVALIACLRGFLFLFLLLFVFPCLLLFSLLSLLVALGRKCNMLDASKTVRAKLVPSWAPYPSSLTSSGERRSLILWKCRKSCRKWWIKMNELGEIDQVYKIDEFVEIGEFNRKCWICWICRVCCLL